MSDQPSIEAQAAAAENRRLAGIEQDRDAYKQLLGSLLVYAKTGRIAGHRCQVCNRQGGRVILDVHHRTYERLYNEAPEDLTVLCRDCHSLYEKDKKHRRKK